MERSHDKGDSDSPLVAARWCTRAAALSGLIAVGLIVIELVSRGGEAFGLILVPESKDGTAPQPSLFPLAAIWILGGLLLLGVRKGLWCSWRPLRPIGQCLTLPLMLVMPLVYAQTVMGWVPDAGIYIAVLTILVLLWLVSLIVLFVRLTRTRFASEEKSSSDPRLLVMRRCARSAAWSGWIAAGLIVIQLVSRGSGASGLDGLHPRWWAPECHQPLCLWSSLFPVAIVWMLGGVLLLLVRRGLQRSWRPVRVLGQCLIALLTLLVPHLYFQAMAMLWMTSAGEVMVLVLTVPVVVWLVSLITLFVRLTQTRFDETAQNG